MSDFASVRGIVLHHQRVGSGPDVVWGHGLTSSMAGDDDLGVVDHQRLAASVTLLRYDARGHGLSGLSTPLADYGWDALARDQLALADALGIERYVAGGASMGAATALHAAVAAPDRVAGLVLMIPPTAWETRAAQVDLYQRKAELIETRGVEAVIAADRLTPPPDPFVGSDWWFERSARAMRAMQPARLAQVLRGAGTADLPPRAAVADIGAPALILAWTGDDGHPLSTARELDDLLARSSLHVASTRGHLDTWTGLVVDFVGAASST